MVSTSEPSSAVRNPRTRKPGVNSEASFSRKAFDHQQEQAQGQERQRKGEELAAPGPCVPFTMAITMVAISAAPKPRTSIPGTICATSHSASALTSHPTTIWTIAC